MIQRGQGQWGHGLCPHPARSSMHAEAGTATRTGRSDGSDLHDVEAATRDVLTAVHAVADQVQPPKNSKAMLVAEMREMIW